MNRELVLEVVVEAIRRVIGEEWAQEVDIGLETSFADDLELESIEFVALAEELQAHYGKELDFVGWLSQKELDEIIALNVAQLVEFIAGAMDPR